MVYEGVRFLTLWKVEEHMSAVPPVPTSIPAHWIALDCIGLHGLHWIACPPIYGVPHIFGASPAARVYNNLNLVSGQSGFI